MARQRPDDRIDRIAVIDEAVSSLTQRKMRTALTCLGTALGVAVLIAVLGLTASAASQIDARFNELTSTEVTVSQTDDGVRTRSMAFPPDAEQRINRLEGVRSSGIVWKVMPDTAELSVSPVPGTDLAKDGTYEVLALSPAALSLAEPTLSDGDVYGGFAQQTHARVAVLGPTAAAQFGITTTSGRPQVQVGGQPFTVIGILETVTRHPELLNSIVVPSGTALKLWGEPSSDSHPAMWITVQRGAGPVIAEQVDTALDPRNSVRFDVTAPPLPRTLQGTISSDIQSLFVMLAGICLIVGMIGIANTTFVTVMERTGEIGLRRALGARRVHIAGQFLTEAAVIGLLGGLVGTFAGVAVVLAVSESKNWTAVLPTSLTILGPVIGVATALIAALYPALRGARIEPITALRDSG